MQQQYFSRGLKSLVLRHGPPSFDEFDSLSNETARCALYSPDGSAFAYATATATHILDPDTRQELCQIPEAAVDMYFSPLGSFLVTWTRPKRDQASGNYLPNLKIWNAKTGEFQQQYVQKTQGSFKGGWQVQFTSDEKFCVQQVSRNALEATASSISSEAGGSLSRGAAVGKLSIPSGIEDFSVSPGRNPAVSVFVASQGGKPASIRVYKLPSLNHPVAQRTLFKAESVLTQWNNLGTALLVVAQTDVDSSNKSYYGESTLYLLSVNSGADQRIALDREGPVYDVAWSPESDEFGVVYGLMPAKTSFFDVRGNEVLELPLAPRNHIKYSPHARFVVVSGFGNLQGHMDVYDRSNKFAKVGTMMATNSSYYDWSPCGTVLVTATTAPRLRVDNGVKLWDYTGRLLYEHEDNELYSVGWRPRARAPLNLAAIAAVQPHSSAANKPKQVATNKPTSAYVPPHQRVNGGVAPSRPTRSLYESTQGSSGQSYRPRQQQQGSGAQSARGGRQAQAQPQAPVPQPAPAPAVKPEEKQIRSLVKKLRAIDELKNRQMAGEPLEVTQVQKIDSEKEVLEKLKALGWTNDE